jgi:hypothetical protein
MRRENQMRKVLASLGALLLCGSAQAALVPVSQNAVPNLDPVPPQVEALPFGEEAFA